MFLDAVYLVWFRIQQDVMLWGDSHHLTLSSRRSKHLSTASFLNTRIESSCHSFRPSARDFSAPTVMSYLMDASCADAGLTTSAAQQWPWLSAPTFGFVGALAFLDRAAETGSCSSYDANPLISAWIKLWSN